MKREQKLDKMNFVLYGGDNDAQRVCAVEEIAAASVCPDRNEGGTTRAVHGPRESGTVNLLPAPAAYL